MVRETRYLIVRNLPENCTEETVIDHFQRYGKIQSVKLQAAKDNDSGSTATVAFNDIKSAAKAHHAKNNLGEVTLRTDYWEGSTGTPVIATPPVTTANAVRSNYTNVSAAPSKPVTTFTNWKKGTEDDSSANQDKGISTSVQVSGVNTPITVSSALEKLSTTPSFDPSSRGRPRERLPKKKFGKFEKNGSFGRHGPSSRSLEAVRSQSEAAAAAAAALAASSASLATTSAVTGSGTTGSSGTSGLNPIIVNDIKDINSNKDNKEVSRDNSLSKSALSPCSRNSGLKKSQSNSRSASRSRSRSLCSKSSSSRSDSSGTSTSNSPHKSVPKSMIGASKLVSSETKKDENDGERRPLGICVTGLPLRSTDSSLRDGLYHEYKKHGKVTSVQICLEGETRCAIVSFRKPEDAIKALEASQGKVFFGAKIKVTSHEGVEVDDSDGTNDNDSLDEYHPKSTRTLFVGNLEKETTKEDLIEKFKRFGEIIDVDVKRQGATTAFAFVQYVDIASVVAALRGMEGEHIGINKIKLGFGKSMPTFCVWVDNLPGDIVSRTLKTAMARYGEITYCLIDKTRSRGLIYFTSYDDAQHCVSDIKMRPHLMKKKLQIDFASRECQSNFLDRMEETGQLRANERPDEARSHNKFRQRSFENTTEEGSPSSYAYSRTTVGYPPRRRGRQYDSTFPEESHQSSRRSRRPEDFSSQSSVYYSGKSSNDDYVAELREYEISKRERRDRDISPRHSSTGRVDSHSRRGSRDHSLDRYEDRQKERTGESFNSREISPSSEHNSFHSENRYRPRDDKYINRDRYEDVKVDDKDFDRHSRPSRTTSPFLQNHTGLHEGDFRHVGSRSQSPPTPLQEDAPRFYVNDDYESSYSRRRDSEDLSKSKPWSTLSTKLGAEVIKTVENRKRTYEQAGLSDSKLVKKPEKSSTLSENKLKNNHRQLDTSNRRRMKGIDHPSSPGSSGSHIDSENGSVSEGDLHHLHQEKQHILKELKECEAEVVDASESDSPLSVARIKSIAVKDNLKSFGRSLEEKRIDELSFRRQEEKHRRSDLKPWIHLSDDLSSPHDNNKHLLGGKDEFIGDNSDSDIELNIKKRRTEFHGDSDLSDEDILDSCSEQNSRIANFPCDSKISSLNSKLFESNKSTDVSSSCDNGNILKGGLSDKDLSVIKPYSTSSISNAWNMSVSALESSPQGDFSSAYSDENTQDSVTSGGSLSGKSFKLSPPGSPLDKDCSGSEFSYTKYVVPDIIAEDSFSDDSLSDNQHAPNAKDLEERLRYIDEFLNGTTSKASDLTLSSSFTNERLRKSGLDGGTLSEKRQEPSVIMQQVLAKKSILDQDIIRLKCNDKKDHTSEMSFPFKSSDWGNKPLLFSSLSHPVTTSSSMLQPTITTSVVSSAYMTAPISTSVLTLSIVSASIASSINISKTAAVDSLHLSRLSESSSKSGVFSEKLPVSTNLLTLEPDVSVCSNSLSSKSVCGLVPCSSMDTVVDSNLLTCPSVGKPVSSTSLSPSLSFLQPLSSTLSSSNSSHLKNTLPQIVPSSSPVTLCSSSSSSSLPLSSSSSLLSSVNKSPMGANVAAPFTQGPDKSQLTPTVGQEAPHLCSPSFTPENSRTSSNSHLPGNRSPRIVTPKQKDDQHISSNKHELTVNISRSEDETKSQVTAAKTELVTPDIESPVSVKSETSSNSSVPLSSLDTKANCALEDKTLPSSHYLGIQTSSSENNNVVVIKSQISSIVDSKSASCIISTENTLDKASSYDGLDSSNNTKNLKNVDVTDWPSKKTEISLPVSCTTVFGVSTKDNSDKKELSSPSDSTSKGKPSSSLPLNNDIVTKSLSNAPSTSAVSLLKQVTEKTDKKTVKPSSHTHSKSPAKSEALFAPDVKVEQLKSEKSEIKHHSKDSHKTTSSNKSNSSIEKKVSKTSKDGPGSKDSEKVDRKTDSSHKSSGHDASKTKESDRSKAKDRKDIEKNKQKDKEDSKKKEEKKVSSDKKDELKVKEDKKIEKKLDDKKEKPEKEKSKEIIKQSMVKKSKPESADLSKKEKKHKSKEVSSKEKVGDKKVLPVLKNTHSEVKSKEMSKPDSKLNKNDHLKSEPTKNDEKNKTESKHKIDTKTVTKNDSKSDSHVASKKHATESSRSKKEADKETSKYISQKLKQRDDKAKEKQKVKEDKEKPKEEKEKLKAEKDEELEKQKERNELEEKEKKEKEERLKREKEERELQKEKEEKERKDKEEKLRREKEEREKEKAQKEKERIERERHEKERKEKEDRDRQHEKERQKEERERKEKEERERKEKEERERKEKEREERERKEREDRERKEKEREERERKEKEERERKEREKEERERKEKDREDRERKEKEDRERKEKEERERKEKEERERKEKEDRERKEKEKEEKERKEKEKEEKERKDKEKEEKERKERERREREKKEKKEKERKAKEEKLRKEKEDKVKKEKEEKAKKDREEKAKKDERERSKKEKEKKEKEKKEDKDDDDKDEKDMKKPPPKKPKRNELAVLLDSNDRFQMTFTSMYDRVKTQRNREPEQHKPEPAPKSSFDKFKQNRKKKGNKAKSSLYSCGSNSDLSDDSDLSESESSQKAEPVKETKPKKTSQIKKRPHVSSSSSSSCEEDDDALLRASKPKGKKADKFSNIFSSDSEDSFPTPKASTKSKSKPIPKRRKTREDSTDSMNSRDEFLKPHVLTTTDQDSLDDIDFSDEDDIPKLSSKKKIKTKKADKSGDNEKRESSVESVNKKVTKLERESSIESLSKKLHKSDKDETPSKKLKTENKSEKHEPDTERKSSAKDDSKKVLEDKKKVKEPVKESSKDKKERKETEPKLGTVMKTESKKDVESKKDSEAKKEVESKKEVEAKKDAEVKIETEKTKVKDKTFDDLSVKNVEDRKKKKDKDDGPVKKKKKKKLDPKAEEERVNSLINKVYDSTNLDKDRKQKKRPKPSIFDSDSDMATSETSVEVTKTTAVEDNKVHKTDTDISKPKEKIIESSKDKEDISKPKEKIIESSKDKEVLKEKPLKHVKDCKSSIESSKKSESKKKEKVTQMDTESEKSSLTESLGKKEKPDITLEKKNQVKSDETTGKPPKKKKKKREHEKDNDKEKLKSPKVAKGDEKINAEKKSTELEKKQASLSDDASNNEPAQVVDEFVSFWGHPKPALIPRRLKDTTKVDDDKKPKEKEDGKTEEKADSVMVAKDVIKEEKTSIEKQDEQLISDRTVKVELESNEEIPVPLSEAETTVTTELAQIASLDTPATTGTGHQTDIGSMNEDVTGVKDETTIGSSVEIHEDDEYPSLVIDELSETVSDEKKKFTKQEKKLLKQQQEEKERNDRIDEVIASVAGGSDIVDDLAVKEKESSQMDSASNDRELDLSDVINLKCEAKFSNENKSIIVSDLLFPDKEKAPEQTLQFGAFRKDKKEPKPIPTTSSKVEEEKTQLISSLAKKDDLKIEVEMVKHLPPTDSVSEKPAISEEQKPTEEELKKKLEEEMKKKQEEEEERKAEEERKKVEEEKARQEKEQQAIREASDEAARAVESLFQSGFTQDSLDMDDDLPPLFIESAEDPPTEVATPSSPAKDKIETDAFFTNSIPEKLTANLDDKLLEETKLLVKGDEADHKIDALNFFAPPQQAVTPGFTSPRRNSTVQDKIPEPAAPIPSPQLQMQSPQRQIPPSPLIQSPQRQISPQRQMQSPQRQLTSPQQIQSPQRPPLQSPLRPLQSPQINLQSPLHSPPFCNKDRSLMSPNREVFVVQDLESSLVQQTQRRASSGLPVSTAEQAIDSFRRKSQEFPAEQMFHSPRRNTISVPEEATSTHLDHRFQHHQGASVIYSKKSPHSHSSLPPPVSISLDNAPHDRNFQTPMRNLNITPQECNLLSPTKKVSPSFHFKDIPADPSLFQTACNKNALQDSLFPSHKSLFNDSMFSHHQKHPAQEQIFHTNKPQIHDILKTSAPPPPPPSEQHVFFKGNVTEKPLMAKLTESNFPFSKNTLQDQLFPQVTQVKIPQLPLDRMPQEPLFSPKGHLDASYNYNEPVDFLLHSPPRNQEFLNYTSNQETQKPLVKPTETIDLFNKDPFHHADTRHNEKVDPSQPRRMEGFPASYYQEPIPCGSLPKFSDNTVIQQQQQPLFDDDKKNKKRKRINKRSTKEDKAAALAEQQAIEQSVQANVESIHKALTASQAKAAAEKAGTNAEKKKSIDAYDFEAHTGQEMVSQNIISGMDHTNFNDDQRLTRSRSDSRGRRRGSVARRGKNGRGGMTSMMDPQDSLLEPLPLQQQPALSQQNPFAVHSHDQVAGQAQTKHGYNPYQFPSQQQQPPLPSFQRQNSQPVGQSFYPSPQSSSDNSSVSLPDWQMKQTVLPQQQSHIVVQPTHQPPHNIPHPQQTQQHQPLVKLPLKPDDRSPETNKLDLDSSFGESELVINLDDQPSSIEGKENHNSFSSDGEAPSPATPKAQRPTRARKQTNYKAIASGTINVPPQARTSRSGGSPRGRLTGGQSPKNNMSPRASSSENVQPSAVVKLEKLEVTRATRRRKGLSKEEVGEDSVNSSFEDWKTKKGDDKKVVPKDNVYEFVDNEQEQSIEPNIRTRARKKRASDNQEVGQSQPGVDYLIGSPPPPPTVNPSLASDKGGYEPVEPPRSSDDLPKPAPLSNVDAVIDAVSKGIFGSNEEEYIQNIPSSTPPETASPPSPVHLPPTTRLTRRSTEAKKEAEQKDVKFTIEPSKSDSRDLGKKGPTVPPLRIKVAHGTPKVEKKEEKHYVIERASKNIGVTVDHSEKPPLAFTVKLSDTGTATIKPSVTAGHFNPSLSVMGKNSVQEGIKYGDANLKKDNNLGLFSGLPQNEQQQQTVEHELPKSVTSQVPPWKPIDSVAMDSQVTRPSGALHPKVAAKIQLSQESLNNASSLSSLVQNSMPQTTQLSNLPPSTSALASQSKSSPSPVHAGHVWNSNIQSANLNQPSPNSHLPLNLQNSSVPKDAALLLQRPPSAHDLINKHPPSAHIQTTTRPDRAVKGGAKIGLDVNQEMATKINLDTSQKHPEPSFAYTGPVPPAHIGQRPFMISPDQQSIPTSHHNLHFPNNAFKANLEVRNSKSPSIPPQSSLKLGSDLGTRTPPVTSGAMLYAGIVAAQPISLSPTSASPEGQVIERLPNPIRPQGDSGCQSPLNRRMHPEPSRFLKDDLESSLPSSVHGDQNPSREMIYLMEQRLHQHLLLVQENSRNPNQDQSRNAEVARNMRIAHDQSRNTPVGLDNVRKNSLTTQPVGLNQPLNLADSDGRADPSRGTPKSTPPASQSPFSLPYLDRKVESGRMQVGVTSAFMQPSPGGARETLSHMYPDLPLGLDAQFGMVGRLSLASHIYASGHPPQHLLRDSVLPGHFPGFPPGSRFSGLEQYSDKKGEPGHPDQVASRGMMGSPSPNPMLSRPADILLMKSQQPSRMPIDLPTNSPVGILQRYPVMWQGALALKNDNSYVQMHFIAGNRRLPNQALPQPMPNGALPPLRISQRMRLEQAQLEGVSKRMQCEDDYCILIAVACGRDQSDISIQTRALNEGFITYLLSKQAAGIVNVPLPGSEQAGFVVHIFPPCEFVDNSVAEQGSLALMEQLREVPHAVIIIATT